MCGFAGFVDARLSLDSREARFRIKDMADLISHRGPDGEGIIIEKTDSGAAWAGIGHRRLAVLDLSPAGEQPMVSRCGRYVIVYNGEIYNYPHLRSQLETRGAGNWRGHSDTEVLLEGIARDGLAATLAQLDGMFAFALLDRVKRTLTLARDAFGEKPLLYGIWRGVLLFGSDLRAFRGWPGFSPREDPQARAQLMQYGYIPAPRTIHEGISKLPPAHVTEISFESIKEGILPEPVAWWDMIGEALAARQNMFEGDFEAAVGAVEDTLTRSVARRMVSDVPIGTMLSGGIDSTLTTALMHRISSEPVNSFTIGMDEVGYDESPHAEAVACHIGTKHETLMLTAADVLNEIPRISACYDEPFADSSQLPTYLVSRLARGHVTVALSGDGGDELFAGYNRYFYGSRIWKYMQYFPCGLRSAVGGGLAAFSPAALTALVRMAGSLSPRELAAGRAGEKLHKLARLLSAGDRGAFHEALLRTGQAHTVLAEDAGAWEIPSDADRRTLDLDFASYAMLFDTSHYLHDDVLAKVDRASMAVSLETRTPFLNRELFSLAWGLPHEFKSEGHEGKRVLRELLYRYVPRELVNRPKAGFTMPIGRWLRGPLVDWAESFLSSEALHRSNVFDVPRVRALWLAHRNGHRDHETQLWSILMYQSWHAAQRDAALTEPKI